MTGGENNVEPKSHDSEVGQIREVGYDRRELERVASALSQEGTRDRDLVLFSGPSGTGKTVAAEAFARGLQRELYRVDLGAIVSQYTGETEKNLDRVFDQAAQSNVLLFFDEADALFGARTDVKDAHDRPANLVMSYFVRRVETFSGTVMVAVNDPEQARSLAKLARRSRCVIVR